ncbi:MAG: leucine-rich repeat domain-containing protein [Candidatus Coproplasma sp.]
MKKKLLLAFLAVVSCCSLALGTTACNKKDEDENKHDHTYETTVVAPTCTEQGYTLHTCTGCDDSYKDTYVNALGHNFTNYVSDGNATCEADGTKTATCDHNGCNVTDAFYNCSGLTNVIIPDSVVNIGDGLFYGCSSLESATIGKGITEIKYMTFAGCVKLTSVVIPNSVTNVVHNGFYLCENTYVYYGGTADEWSKISITSQANDAILNAARRYYYSETEPALNEEGTAYDGNYWHYVDGEIVVWVKD